MGLRTVEGVCRDELAALDIPAERLSDLKDLIKVGDERLMVTARGRPVLDAIITQLAGAA